jgi:predicted phosphodiesterase
MIGKEITMKNKQQPDAIFTADWHLRDSHPICRADDFWEAQWAKVREVFALQQKWDIPIFHAGDLFNEWKASPFLLQKTVEEFPMGKRNFQTIYGNHDLPQHQIDLANKSGIAVLEKAQRVKVLSGLHWNDKFSDDHVITWKGRKIVLWHEMIHQGKRSFPGAESSPAAGILRRKEFNDVDVVITGHNHLSFVEEYEGRILVNTGCLTRQESDQKDFKPVVWLYYAESNTVEPYELSIQPGVVSEEHNIRQQERADRITAFIERLNTEWEGGLSFEDNLEAFCKANKVNKRVKDIIYELIEK